jgi:hypothetical protein
VSSSGSLESAPDFDDSTHDVRQGRQPLLDLPLDRDVTDMIENKCCGKVI